MKRERITPAQAVAEGFDVDRSCYPWIAYRGPRFNPDVYRECMTANEAELVDAFRSLLRATPIDIAKRERDRLYAAIDAAFRGRDL